ncbi:MAG: hypothetical protein AB2L24_23935 [Mangrovibacterium sp.]
MSDSSLLFSLFYNGPQAMKCHKSAPAFSQKTDKKAANLLREKLNGKPKDYGIMAGFRRHPSGLIPFPFGSPLFPHWLAAFFFSVFSFGKMLFRAGSVRKRQTNKNGLTI